MTDTEYEKWFETEPAGAPVSLSQAGRVRRGAMQRALQAAVVARRRRRTAVRWSTAALAAALLVAVVWPTPGSAPASAVAASQVALHNFDYGVVRDDTSTLPRYSASPSPLPAETWVDDDQLLELLAAANRRTGLIRTPQRVVLTRNVVDPLAE